MRDGGDGGRVTVGGVSRTGRGRKRAGRLHRVAAALRERGARAGVALNPATPDLLLEQALDWIDHVLVMSVNPGFSGQTFIPQMMAKIAHLRRRIEARGLRVEVGVDGGVTQGNIRAIADAGAHACVAGSAVFDRQDPIQALRALRSAAETETV